MRKKVFVLFLASVFSFFLSVFSISKVSAAYLSEYNVSREEDVTYTYYNENLLKMMDLI